MTIAEFEPTAIVGDFALTFSLSGVSIGENATAANLAEVFGVEGATELNESAFSFDGLSFNLQRTDNGKARATVVPDGAPPAFFLRVKVK